MASPSVRIYGAVACRRSPCATVVRQWGGRRPGQFRGRGEARRCLMMGRVEDVDAHCEHARSLGATITSPLTDLRYGERQYSVEDPGGHRWMFSQTLADIAPEE